METQELYLVWGGVGALVIALLGYRFRALSASGAVAALIVGTIIFGFGGYVGAAVLLYFFISGSILSRLPGKLQTGEKLARNWVQVLANGGPAAIAVILIHAYPTFREMGTLFFLGTLAAATADTWATEIGTRWGKQAYHILTFRPVAPGLSGGVTLIGTVASVLGSVSLALLANALLPGDDFLCGLFLVPIVPVVAAAGVIGSILDSIIGATLQVKYRTMDGGRIVERPETGAERIQGLTFVTNDVTNILSTIWAGCIAVGLTTL